MYIVDIARATAIPMTEKITIEASHLKSMEYDLKHGEDVLTWGTMKYLMRVMDALVAAYSNGARVFYVDSIRREEPNNG